MKISFSGSLLLCCFVFSLCGSLQADQLRGADNALSKEMMKASLGQERVKAFQSAMKDVGSQEQMKFWEHYKAYAMEVSEFDGRRFTLTDKYMTNYMLLSAAQSRDLMDQWIRLQQDELASRIRMFKRLSRKVSPVVGTRFFQVDDYISAALKIQYMGNYPIFGEKLGRTK